MNVHEASAYLSDAEPSHSVAPPTYAKRLYKCISLYIRLRRTLYELYM